MAGMGTAAGFGAGEGADMLQRILLRVAQEEQAKERAKAEQQRIALDQRQIEGVEKERAYQRELDAQPKPAKIHAVGGRLVDDTGKVVYDSPAEPPKPPGMHTINGALVDDTGKVVYQSPQQPKAPGVHVVSGNLVDDTGKVIFRAPKEPTAAAKAQADATAKAKTAEQNEITDALGLIDRLSSDEALAGATGPLDEWLNRGVMAGGPMAAGRLRGPGGLNRVEAAHNQLVGMLQLAQAGKLKGQGAVSNIERQLLGNAASSLKLGLPDKDYRAELARIRAYFQRAAQQQGGAMQPSPTHGTPKLDVDALLKKYGG